MIPRNGNKVTLKLMANYHLMIRSVTHVDQKSWEVTKKCNIVIGLDGRWVLVVHVNDSPGDSWKSSLIRQLYLWFKMLENERKFRQMS